MQPGAAAPYATGRRDEPSHPIRRGPRVWRAGLGRHGEARGPLHWGTTIAERYVVSEGTNTPGAGDPNAGAPTGGAPPPPQQPPGPPPAPSTPQQGTGVGQPADLLTRFLARLIDGILLSVVFFALIVPIIIGAMFTGGNTFGFGGSGLVTSALGAVLYTGYFAFLESNRGQTLGKMLMKIEVRGPDGQHPSLEVAIKRNAWLLLSIIPIIGGLAQFVVSIIIAVTINNNVQTRQGWHDDFAGGTSVIKVG
jgi:uncharacterized RDD family membrane protein YckC